MRLAAAVLVPLFALTPLAAFAQQGNSAGSSYDSNEMKSDTTRMHSGDAPTSGRSSVPDGTPSMTPSSGNTPSGEADTGIGRGQK